MSSSLDRSRPALLKLYKELLRSAATFPSKNRARIYQEIRSEWRVNRHLEDPNKLHKELSVAYKGLQQLRQYDERSMTGGKIGSSSWSVTLEQNPMPKPEGYDENKKKKATTRDSGGPK
jgi:LYR motif-containing protein 4